MSRLVADPSSGPARPLAWLSPQFGLTLIAVLLICAAYSASLPVLPLVVERLTGRVDVAGVVTGAIAVGAVTFELATYRLLKRWPADTVLMFGFTLGMLAMAGFSMARDLWLFLMLGAIFGSGFGIVVSGTTAIVGHLAEPATRGRAYGLYGMVATIPTVVAPTAGLVLLSAWSAPAVFQLLAACCALGLPVSVSLRSLPRYREAMTPTMTILRNPRVVIVLVAYTILSTTYGAVVSFTAFVVHGEGFASAPSFFFVMGVARVVSRLVAGSVLDRLHEQVVSVLSLVIIGMGLVCITFGGMPWIPIAGVLYGAGFGAVQTAAIYALLKQSPPDATAVVSGWWNFAIDGGVGLGAAAFAPAAAAIGYEPMFRLLPVVLAIPLALRLGEGRLVDLGRDVAKTANNS